jgi:hypothetical protein
MSAIPTAIDKAASLRIAQSSWPDALLVDRGSRAKFGLRLKSSSRHGRLQPDPSHEHCPPRIAVQGIQVRAHFGERNTSVTNGESALEPLERRVIFSPDRPHLRHLEGRAVTVLPLELYQGLVRLIPFSERPIDDGERPESRPVRRLGLRLGECLFGSPLTVAGSTLTATSRPSRVSRAR